ncbi:MAG: hypothetical protein U1F16_09525 [Turneriella sp.]
MQPPARRALKLFVLQKNSRRANCAICVTVATTAERLSTQPIWSADIDGIVSRFGVEPDVTTWGDFFAAEIKPPTIGKNRKPNLKNSEMQ